MKKRLLTMLTLCSCAVLLASCRASADTRAGQADGYGGILRVQVMMEDAARTWSQTQRMSCSR